ncbi:uncharacterized protein LOC134280058 [Saccostrea cucullata]|uniref:uncharacterized protein LOC134280058 n=1 Tax=Saccostrea cuccullata TaxID=36930 RepID=UPI002ED12E90
MDNQKEENPECLSFKEKLKRFQIQDVPSEKPSRGLKKPDNVYNNDTKVKVKVLPTSTSLTADNGKDNYNREHLSSEHVRVRQKSQYKEESVDISSDFIETSDNISDSDFVEYEKTVEISSLTVTENSESVRDSDSVNVAKDVVSLPSNGENIKKGTNIPEANFITHVNQGILVSPRGVLQRQSNVTETTETLSNPHLQRETSLPPYPTPPYPLVDSITVPRSASVGPMVNFQPCIGFEGFGEHPMSYTRSSSLQCASQHPPQYMIEPKMPMPDPQYSVSDLNTDS